MDIGKQRRVIVVEPEPLTAPREAPVEAPDPAPRHPVRRPTREEAPARR